MDANFTRTNYKRLYLLRDHSIDNQWIVNTVSYLTKSFVICFAPDIEQKCPDDDVWTKKVPTSKAGIDPSAHQCRTDIRRRVHRCYPTHRSNWSNSNCSYSVGCTFFSLSSFLVIRFVVLNNWEDPRAQKEDYSRIPYFFFPFFSVVVVQLLCKHKSMSP